MLDCLPTTTIKKKTKTGSTGKLSKTLKEEIISILHKLFQKIDEEKTLPNSFYEVSIILIPKVDKGI